MKLHKTENMIKNSRFPKSVFFAFFISLLVIGGPHYGLLYGMQEANFPPIIVNSLDNNL